VRGGFTFLLSHWTGSSADKSSPGSFYSGLSVCFVTGLCDRPFVALFHHCCWLLLLFPPPPLLPSASLFSTFLLFSSPHPLLFPSSLHSCVNLLPRMAEDISLLRQLDVLAMPSRLDPAIHFLRYIALLRTLSRHIRHLQSQVQLAWLNSTPASDANVSLPNPPTPHLASSNSPTPPAFFTPIRPTPSLQKEILDTSMLLMLRFCRVVLLQLPKHPTFRRRFHTAALSALVVETQLFQRQIHNYCENGSQAFLVAFTGRCANRTEQRPPVITISSPTDQSAPLSQTITDPSLLSGNTSITTLALVAEGQKQSVISASISSRGIRDTASGASQSTILPISTTQSLTFTEELAILSKIDTASKQSSVSGNLKGQSGAQGLEDIHYKFSGSRLCAGKQPLDCNIALSDSGQCVGTSNGDTKTLRQGSNIVMVVSLNLY